MQPNQDNQKQPAQTNAPKKDVADSKVDNAALWSLLAGIAVFLYHAGIAIIQPDTITIFWYVTALPILFGVSGVRSKARRPLAIAGMALGAISIVIVVILFSTIYKFK